jgi:hypothetical protein
VVNPVTKQYIDECLGETSKLRDVVRRAPIPAEFREVYGNRFVDRPWFAEQAQLQSFADELAAFIDLLLSLPRRLFGGDLRKYCAALGVDERSMKLMCRDAAERPPRYARPDLYFDGTSFKLLEFNICSALGGLDHATVNSALLAVPEFREFAEQHGLGYTDTAAEFARALHRVADPVAGGDRPVVAMVEWKDGLSAFGKRMQVFREVMGKAGLDVRPTEVGRLTERKGKLYLDDGTPVDMVLRYFILGEICSDPAGEEAIEPILRAHDAGKTVLFTTLETYLYTNKGCLSMLSDPRWRPAFSAEESALIDRVLPWTRHLTPGPAEIDGQTTDLVDYTRANRDSLLLKPLGGHAGIGVVAGWEVSDAEWLEAVSETAGHDYIVQRRVIPQAEPVCDPDTGELRDWIAAWTCFFTDEGYAGSSFVRTIPAGGSWIISPSTKPGMRTTSLFTY